MAQKKELDKHLARQPIVLVEQGAKGIRITATNRAAEKAGAMIGQMLNDARAGCPELQVEKAEIETDRQYLSRLGHWAMRYSPTVALDGNDGLLIDIAGCDHLFGGEDALVEDVLMRFEKIGLSARAGLADTPGAAWALARFGGKLTTVSAVFTTIAPPGKTIEATAAMPVEALRLEDKVVLLLQRLGLKQISALRAIPRAALERRFRSRQASHSVQLRLDQMAGNIREPLAPLKEVPPCRETFACPEPAIESGAIEVALSHLLTRLEHRLGQRGLGARSLTLTACHSDGGYDALTITLGRAARDADYIARLFNDRLERIDPGFGIDLFILSADRVEKMVEDQRSLATGRHALPDDVIPLIDRLMNRLGAEHIIRLYPLESHLPERAQKTVQAGMVVGAKPMTEQIASWQPTISTPRPFRLFERPEPVEAIAGVPDGPPLRFIWRRLSRTVIRARGPERIAPEWWQETADKDGFVGNHHALILRTNARDYYEVEDDEGSRYWLFRSGLYGAMRNDDQPQWFIHGLFG